jgi:hypothetical protein
MASSKFIEPLLVGLMLLRSTLPDDEGCGRAKPEAFAGGVGMG